MLTRQILRIFLFFLAMTALAALSVLPSRAAPFAAHVMDARTGETLYAKNSETRLHPASLTKMLTLYIAFDAVERGEISLDTMVTVSKHAAAQPPSRLGLRAGQRIALRYLIRAAAVKSANDAASAIGDALSGNEAKFAAARMNRTAKALGMKNSTFKNANGLTAAGHLSTARDMSTLGRRLFYDFPQYYNIFSRRTADAGMAQVANTNRRFLDGYKGADGIKTGYTVAAGFNLTASAERGPKRIIATVFGGTSTAQRNAKMMELMDLGFGEAPTNALVRKPEPANLPTEAPDLLADSEGEEGASAKTIRVSTVMKTSPRPRARPGAEPFQVAEAAPVPNADAEAAAAMVGALQSSINDAVAAAAAPEDPAPVEVASAADTGATGITNAKPAPRPADLTGADPTTAEADEAEALPFALLDPNDAVALPVTDVPGEAMPFALVDADGNILTPPEAVQSGEVMPFAVVESELAPDGQPGEVIPFAIVAPEDLPPDTMPEETTIVALAAPAPMPKLLPLPTAVAEAEPEVITRLSTSGGRNWGVSLGQMNSRGAAERVLTKTTLTEGRALGDGLRKIVSRGGGYDATVLGLTEDQAALACQRLTARAMECTVIGP
jgi:D-alanyl-D-alanine carboxypeptidase